MDKSNVELKSRSKVIVFLIILVLIFTSLFAITSVYIIRCKKTEKAETQANENSVTFSSLSGAYVGDAKALEGKTFGNEKEVRLELYEDGSFRYNNEPGLASGIIGYYTFTNDEIVLHGIVGCANDIGRTIISNKVTLKINSDKSLTDNKLDAKLQKSTDSFENQKDIISTQLKSALEMKVLD